MNTWVPSLLASLEATGQTHIVDRAHLLSEEDRARFLTPLQGLDIERICQAATRANPSASGNEKSPEIIPPKSVDRTDEGSLSVAEEDALQRGEQLLREGKVAILVVAGGMGSRLGWPGPKGTYPVGPITNRSLFQVFAESIRSLTVRFGATIPWAIQTSPNNHQETMEFLETHSWFGLPSDDAFPFPQGILPAFVEDGQIAIREDGELVALPDGHGGVFQALGTQSVLPWFASRGVEHVYYFQVDNPLSPIGDPRFMGHHARSGSEMSTMIIAKTHPEERVGVLAHVNGALQVIEYTEIDETLAGMRNPDGRLTFRAANTGIHAFTLPFLERMSQAGALPLHTAEKPIPTGPANDPDSHTRLGTKLEYFVFDALPHADNPLIYEAPRHEAFAPLKSVEGNDTPEQARSALQALYRGLMKKAGIEISETQPIEISPLLAHDLPALAAAFHSLDDPTESILLTPPDSAGS